MKHLIPSLLMSSFILLVSCKNEKNNNEIHFSISPEYPPYEYMVHGKLQGFDVDLGRMLSRKIGKKAVFDNMQFSSVLPALTSGQVDAAISTITITPERRNNIDFTIPYHFEAMGVVFKQEVPIDNVSQLADKKVACQLGSTMETWLKKNIPHNQIMVMDNNNQAIEALKAGYVDAVLVDGAQSNIFSKKNPGLASKMIAKSEDGYGIALKKGSPMLKDINQALIELQASGEIEKLEKKWLGDIR